jgi:hypothetical protein
MMNMMNDTGKLYITYLPHQQNNFIVVFWLVGFGLFLFKKKLQNDGTDLMLTSPVVIPKSLIHLALP